MALIPLPFLLFCVIGLQLTLFVVISASELYPRELHAEPQGFYNLDITPYEVPKQMTHRFDHPRVALEVLKQLDVFKPVPDSIFIKYGNKTNGYDQPMIGLKNDDEYCDKHRAYFVAYPEIVFQEINFVTEFRNDSLVRSKALKPAGNDIMPYVGKGMPKKIEESFTYDIKPYANLFHSTQGFQFYKHVGKHYSCLSQESNHIPGNSVLGRKSLVAQATIDYAKQFADRPQCFNYDKFFPKTWILYNKEDCEDFFREFNSPEYLKAKKERRIVYIRKVGAGSHGGDGVQPVNDEEEAHLREHYKNGTKCGKINTNYLIQHYVHNPLLIQGRKFDFRMYMFIASTNPIIAYYHDGGLRVSLNSYDVASDDKKTLLTNIGLNKKIYKDAREGDLFNGMDEESLKLAQEWTFDRLQNYLLEAGIISDPNWLDNYLRPEFKKAFIHIIRLAAPKLLRTSSVYEVFGMDFMLDENLNLWFVEANAGPAFPEFSQPIQKMVLQMFHDEFEIVFGLLRSRMKRVVKYVNELIETGAVREVYTGEVVIDDLERRRQVFEEITKNYFEPEYEPSPNNSFSKIIDENYEGVERYQGLIDEECL